MTDSQTGTILFQPSPFGSVDGIVQQDGRTVYFYLHGKPPFGMRACWVMNLQTGPLEFNQNDLQSGQSPLLPRPHCIDPNPSPMPVADDLQIVWFETGNAAALLHRNEIASVIPPWSGRDGFHGYARNCASENMVCWPMPAGPELATRVESAKNNWQRWVDNPPFKTYQPEALKSLEQRFGPVEKYFSIDGGNFPPRGLVQLCDDSGTRHLVTVGMALCPQPEPLEISLPGNYRPHIELGIRLKTDETEEGIDRVAGRISSIASIPWHNFSWLGQGHSCDFLADDSTRAVAAFESDNPVTNGGTPWTLPQVSLEIAGSTQRFQPELLWIVPRPNRS